jgi:hypothetical protein
VDRQRSEGNFRPGQWTRAAAVLIMGMLSFGCSGDGDEHRDPSPGSTPSTSASNSTPPENPSAAPAPPAAPPPTNPIAPGALRWSAALPGQPNGVAGDSSGNVYVATTVYPPNGGDAVAQVWKFDSGGRKQWSTEIGPGWWSARDQLGVTPAGEVALGVCSAPFCYSADPTAVQAAVMRITSAGKIAWTTRVSGRLGSLDVDARGRTLLTVSSGDLVSGLGYRVLLLGDAGEILLEQETDLAFARASLGSIDGDFAVAGKDPTGKLAFERRRSDGATAFRNALDTPGGSIDRLALAPDGTIAVGGWFEDHFTWGSAAYDVMYTGGFIALATGSGSPDWSKHDSDLAAYNAVPPNVAFGARDSLVTFTMTYGKGMANLRSYGRDGTPEWRQEFRGVYGTWVHATAVAGNGDIVVVAHGTRDAPFQGLSYEGHTPYVAVLAP